MKGILLAAGMGTRLRPLIYVLNKTAIPVYNQPMFFYGLKTILDAGIKEIIIVINNKFGNEIKTLVKHYPNKINAKIRYVIQSKPLGMVDAIKAAKKFTEGHNIFVCTGDNILSDNYKKEVRSFKSGAIAFLRKVKDPQRFGCPLYDKNKKIIKIVEKPKNPQTNYAITAPYIFDKKVFELIKQLKPSQRGELEITDLMNLYLDKSELALKTRKDDVRDAGTFDSLLEVSLYVSKNLNKFFQKTN